MIERKRAGIELLSPAGDREKLEMAVQYGADAVYLALTSFGMRAFAGNCIRRNADSAACFPVFTDRS